MRWIASKTELPSNVRSVERKDINLASARRSDISMRELIFKKTILLKIATMITQKKAARQISSLLAADVNREKTNWVRKWNH